MNLKALGTFVLTLGIALSLLGGGIMIVNQPINMDSERARGDGLKILITGMVLTFVGIAFKGIAFKLASPKKPAISYQPTVQSRPVPPRMPVVEREEQTHDTGSEPLPRCPKCGAPSYDLRNHRCRASVPDRNY